MFTATAPVPILDHLRVPYVVETPRRGEPGDTLRVDRSGREVRWVSAQRLPAAARTSGVFEVAGCRVAGHVVTGPPQRWAHRPAQGRRERWTTLHRVVDLEGREVSEVVVDDRGDVLLPFDPSVVMGDVWAERYRGLQPSARRASRARSLALRGYYAVRPALPRPVQLALRRRLARRPTPPDFPRWPLETGLHDLYGWFLGLLADVAEEPVPWIAPWPDGAAWCLVLTHDVETHHGLLEMERLRGPERAAGFRSSWNFVPERYETPPGVVRALWDAGCEVGVHGLRHDGRDLASPRMARRRLPGMRRAAARWGATGFRSPATQRHWSLMPQLGFDYDTSYTDTDPYEPQPGGCCSYWPLLNDDLVELPITLPQDHTLFAVLGHEDATTWLEKSRELRRRGGMVLALSHPDYAEGNALQAWCDLLADLRDDPTMWHALPRDVATWWRARAASSPVRGVDGWGVAGPIAGRGAVVTAQPARAAVTAPPASGAAERP